MSADRLRKQMSSRRRSQSGLAPFRCLQGIEVDIEDGSLDQEDGLLAELDVVVSSVHSSSALTRRL